MTDLANSARPWLLPALASLPLLLATGCRGEHVELRDEGTLCLGSSDEPPRWHSTDAPVEAVREGGVLHVHVLEACLSSSCDIDRRAECEVRQEGAVLTVRSRLRWTTGASRGCTDDCGVLAAHCESPPLAAGTYTVRHGTSERTVEVPGNIALPCGD